MMALLWDDILADVTSSKTHFRHAVEMFDAGLATGDARARYAAAMAFQHAMQAGYTSFESAMRRLLTLLDEPLPIGPDAHAALLRRLGRPAQGSRPAVFDAATLAQLSELRRFRHVAMHAYDDFTPGRAAGPVEAARAYVVAIDSTLDWFRTAIDPP